MFNKGVKIILVAVFMQSSMTCISSDFDRMFFLKPYPVKKTDSALLVQYSSDHDAQGIKDIVAFFLRKPSHSFYLRMSNGISLENDFKNLKKNMNQTICFELNMVGEK